MVRFGDHIKTMASRYHHLSRQGEGESTMDSMFSDIGPFLSSAGTFWLSKFLRREVAKLGVHRGTCLLGVIIYAVSRGSEEIGEVQIGIFQGVPPEGAGTSMAW